MLKNTRLRPGPGTGAARGSGSPVRPRIRSTRQCRIWASNRVKQGKARPVPTESGSPPSPLRWYGLRDGGADGALHAGWTQ